MIGLDLRISAAPQPPFEEVWDELLDEAAQAALPRIRERWPEGRGRSINMFEVVRRARGHWAVMNTAPWAPHVHRSHDETDLEAEATQIFREEVQRLLAERGERLARVAIEGAISRGAAHG